MHSFGKSDNTFQAVGGEEGIRKLVDTFYEIMGSSPAFNTIWRWHPKDKQISRDKLAAFLSGWMGGPRRYQEQFGSISIPQAHAHLPVTEVERDMWLACMRETLERLAYPEQLVHYLMQQLAIPAERIRLTCQETHSKD